MNTIVDYKIVSDRYSRTVEIKVKKLMLEGYELLGGASYGGGDHTGNYTQAMVKRAESKEG